MLVLKAHHVAVGDGPDGEEVHVSRGDIAEVIIVKGGMVNRRMIHRLSRIFKIDVHLFYRAALH